MGLNYNKWDSLDAYSSDSDSTYDNEGSRSRVAATLRLKALAADDSRPKGVLVTVPWDSHCEAVRWALDSHGISYVEETYPWGLHLWATLAYSDPYPKAQQCGVPVFKSGKGEVLKRSSVDIFTYLFAHSLSSNIRLYTPPRALDLQTYFDETLAPAARTIFLHTALSSPSLSRTYLLHCVHLNTWRALGVALWPLTRVLLERKHPITEKAVSAAWQDVERVFSRVDAELAEQSRISTAATATGGAGATKPGGANSNSACDRKQMPFMCGATVTAADISFAAHAIQVLFANSETDHFASSLRLLAPPTSVLPPAVAARVRVLRASRAGQHAIRMYRRERGQSFASQQSRYSAVNNPWWVDVDAVVAAAAVVLAAVGGGAGLLVWRLGLLAAGAAVMAMMVASAVGIAWGIKDTVFATRIKQLWFVCFFRTTVEETPTQSGDRAKDSKANVMPGTAPSSAADSDSIARAAEVMADAVAAAKSKMATTRLPGGTASAVAAAKES